MRHALAVLLLTTLVAGGCGTTTGDDGAAARFERELAAMAGVAEARVERQAFDTDYWGEEIVVDLDGDARAEEVTAVLDAFLDRRRETRGDPQDARVTIGAGTTDSDGDEFTPAAPPQAVPAGRPAGNDRIARLLVAAVAAFPGHFVSVTSGNWSVIGAAEGEDLRPEIDRMIRVVGADRLLATTRGLDLTAASGPDDDRRTISLHAPEGLTPELRSSWEDLAPRLVTPLLRALWLGPAFIHLDVRVGGDATPRTLTTEAYGEALWPTLRVALDALVAMRRTATLTVVNRYDVAGGGHLEDRFLLTRPQLRVGRDRLGRTWNAEAAAYLDRRSAGRAG